MALPVLSLRQHGLLHYYEQRDGGLFHVIRQLGDAENHDYLTLITSETGFQRDRIWLGDLPTVSILKDSFSHADATALKSFFPNIKMVNMPDESVIYDGRTITVDRGGKPPKNPDSYFNKRNVLKYDIEHEVASLIVQNNQLPYEFVTNIEFKAKVAQAIEWFNQGELNLDTWPVWWVYFNTERNFLEVADLDSPEWKPFFDKLSQSLEISLHPGAHRLYPATLDPNESPDSAADVFSSKPGLIYPSNTNNRIGFASEYASNNPSSWAIQASVGKRNEQTADVSPIPAKGYVELNYDMSSGNSTLAKIDDLPIPLKVRLAPNIGHSVFENRMIAEKISVGMTKVMTAINEKRGQYEISKQVLELSRLMSFVLSHKKDPNHLPLHQIHLRNNSRLKDFGLLDDFAQVIAALVARRHRIARVFDRNLFRTQTITNLDKRKEALQDLFIEQLELRRGLGATVTVGHEQIQEMTDLFTNIDELSNVEELLMSSPAAFDKESRPIIIKTLQSYEEAKADVAKEKLRKQQEQNRSQIMQTSESESAVPAPGTNASLFDLNGEGRKVVHEDVGVKIGGARKDLYTRINSGNLKELNLEEKAKYVRKDRIWPKPDWRLMSEKPEAGSENDQAEKQGLSLAKIYFIKNIRDAICQEPEKLSRSIYRKSSNSLLAEKDEDFTHWLTAVEFVRDKLMSAKDEGFEQVIREIQDFLDKPGSDDYTRTSTVYDDSTTFLHALGNSFKRKFLLGRHLANQYGVEIRYSRSDDYYKKMLNIKPKATNTQVTGNETEGEGEANVKAKLPYPEHLKSLTRIGPDWRKGEDVTGEDLLNTFGFRGIEYGNWVGNNERQIVLNHAYDAYMDLAYAIGLAPDQFKMISMNGTLALGFGSRGHGKALAHFEPINNVINITKIKGAGSMGHEWFHAFDAYLAKLTGLTSMREKLFSEIIISKPAHLREQTLSRIENPAIQGMARAVLSAINHCRLKTRTQEVIDQEIAAAYHQAAFHLGSYARNIAYDYLKGIGKNDSYPSPPTSEIANMLKDLGFNDSKTFNHSVHFLGKISARIVMDKLGGGEQMSDKQKERLIETLIADMSSKAKEQSRIGLEWLSRQLRTAKDSTALVETNYLKEAMKLDGKSKQYWQTPCELLARSFSVAIYEKLKGNGQQSDYLVRGAERKEFADSTIYKGNSNPEGDERDVLNACHDEILNAIFEHTQLILPTTKTQDELSMALSM